ncbi:MAG: bifunctional diguanylate cyclase/phosphodiesterase, partial [Pseudomonadales bacterium]|nr:bifunctional diguanylate cyclase/phosphodiesterase [Pseudomonadales bacterium]
SRLGGDEFTVLLTDLDSEEPAHQVAEKILTALRQPIELGTETVTVTMSIGITMAPVHGDDPIELMKFADIAMYKAKEGGKNSYQLFAPQMLHSSSENLTLESEIRHAIAKNQFQLYYQPQIDLINGDIIGLEALVRWNHPDKGFLNPGSFIEKAEELGLIEELSHWILERAFSEMTILGQQSERLKDVKLAVNLSAKQFNDVKLTDFIADLLEQSGFSPARLELEITETALMQDIDAAATMMHSLRELGVSLSIDDFGTGHASLNYLRRFPVETLKIDASFIREIPHKKEDMEITAAVIAMAHKLNIKVVAEGVETPQQLQFLQQNLCDYAQGYYIAPPLPAAALAEIFQSQQTLPNIVSSLQRL